MCFQYVAAGFELIYGHVLARKSHVLDNNSLQPVEKRAYSGSRPEAGPIFIDLPTTGLRGLLLSTQSL